MQIHKFKGQGPASFGQSTGNCLWPCKRNPPSVKFRKEISVPKLITRGRISSQVPEVLNHWGLVWSSGYDAFLMRWTREQFPGETLGGQAASPQLRQAVRKPTASSRWLSCEKKDVLPYLARDLGWFFPWLFIKFPGFFTRFALKASVEMPSLKHVDFHQRIFTTPQDALLRIQPIATFSPNPQFSRPCFFRNVANMFQYCLLAFEKKYIHVINTYICIYTICSLIYGLEW